MRPIDAWTLRRALTTAGPLNGELEALSEPYCRLVEHLTRLRPTARQTALDGFLCARDDAAKIVKALADVDPEVPPPEDEQPSRPATLADVRAIAATVQWLWPGYIPQSRVAGIAAYEGIGKTRFALDLARRIWLALDWPDGQPAALPEGTPTLWVCADGQQDDMIAAADAFRLPDEAI
jgi:hypothetical protein